MPQKLKRKFVFLSYKVKRLFRNKTKEWLHLTILNEETKTEEEIKQEQYEIDPFLSQALNYNPKDKEPSK